MAHKTLIGGTAYEIKGGRTLVGGTGYDIKGGRTLVGGTAYDVSFAPPVVAVTITSLHGGSNGNLYALINGVKYTGEASGITVLPGDCITFSILSSFWYNSYGTGILTIDGTQVATANGGVIVTYDWTVPEGISAITIQLIVSITACSITVTTS